MQLIISPAKNLDEHTDAPAANASQPALLAEAQMLVETLKNHSPQDIAALMHVSDKIALLNVERFARWHTPFTQSNAKPAVYLFNGDVYEGLSVRTLPESSINYLQKHLAILSGLYGILRPLDLIQAYRLEMGTPLPNPHGKNLYEFWGRKITEHLNGFLAEDDQILINLASQEYFKSVQTQYLNARIITPVFKDYKNGQYKIISFYAKQARGMMVRYAAEHQIREPEALKNFDTAGYAFSPADSSENEWVFLRG